MDGLTSSLLLTTLETVINETPASRATSEIVTRLDILSLLALPVALTMIIERLCDFVKKRWYFMNFCVEIFAHPC